MRCEQVRAVLSARMDGEAPGGPVGAPMDEHLAGCAGCRAWEADARRVTRAIRLQSVQVPDLTAQILAAAQADPTGVLGRAAAVPSGPPASRPAPPRSTGRLRSRWQWVLGLLAVVQVVVAVPALLGAVGHDAHAGRELAAFDIALAVGFLLAACYPAQARTFVPVAAALAVCLALASAVDLADGIVSPAHEAGHLIAIGESLVVWLLARRVSPPVEPNGTTAGGVGMIAR